LEESELSTTPIELEPSDFIEVGEVQMMRDGEHKVAGISPMPTFSEIVAKPNLVMSNMVVGQSSNPPGAFNQVSVAPPAPTNTPQPNVATEQKEREAKAQPVPPHTPPNGGVGSDGTGGSGRPEWEIQFEVRLKDLVDGDEELAALRLPNTPKEMSVDPDLIKRFNALVGDETDNLQRKLDSLPTPPDHLVPIAPPIENLPAMEAELAAKILFAKLSHGEHVDEKKVDPPIHLEALPHEFKVRRDVPWYKKMYRKLFGCCISLVSATRHYTLDGVLLSDFHINGLDVRATNALSHTMLRQEPYIVRVTVVPYDQYDSKMAVLDVDPVSWKARGEVDRTVIHVPMVLVADMMRKFMAADPCVGDLHTMYQDLVKVINVPYNDFLSSEPDFIMFGLDLMTWTKQRRQYGGLQNFHSNQST